jgi:glycosyltransferase involved in cell wall biosynthesis
MWGTLPFGVSLLAIFLALSQLRDRKAAGSEAPMHPGSSDTGTRGDVLPSPVPAHVIACSISSPKPEGQMTSTSCSIVIPAYNEAKRISVTLECILKFIRAKRWDADVIVVNDGSTDETAAVVRSWCAKNPEVSLIDNPVNQGKGRAIRDGVIRASGDIILFADADNSTPIEDSQQLIAAINAGADIAIGSRWTDRKLQVLPQPAHRRLNGRIYNLLLRTILGLDYKDTQNGFKAYTRGAAKSIFSLQRVPGWGFDAEVLYLAKLFEFEVREVPVEYTYCAEGSKIHPHRDGLRMLGELLKVKWYALTRAYYTVAPMDTPATATPLSAISLQEERPSE